MRPVSQCDPSTTILGYKSSIPVFVCGAALAKLGHPQGDIIFFLPGLSSLTPYKARSILPRAQESLP